MTRTRAALSMRACKAAIGRSNRPASGRRTPTQTATVRTGGIRMATSKCINWAATEMWSSRGASRCARRALAHTGRAHGCALRTPPGVPVVLLRGRWVRGVPPSSTSPPGEGARPRFSCALRLVASSAASSSAISFGGARAGAAGDHPALGLDPSGRRCCCGDRKGALTSVTGALPCDELAHPEASPPESSPPRPAAPPLTEDPALLEPRPRAEPPSRNMAQPRKEALQLPEPLPRPEPPPRTAPPPRPKRPPREDAPPREEAPTRAMSPPQRCTAPRPRRRPPLRSVTAAELRPPLALPRSPE